MWSWLRGRKQLPTKQSWVLPTGGSNPSLRAKADKVSASCQIALFVIGVQVRMSLVKEVQFLCGTLIFHYGLLIKLSEV